ncbi:MAG: prepilin-type N-terminal cleavage/methylation domain-containing protein [Muribaculaceae bacterium]|nr:prepilin-type N-terminal cleavage/methylation domain-containing protein [Muribaculaceae bacterium]
MKKGFTLAEILITLGIIGVVAAITIPGLITTHKKHVTASKLKKAVSTLNQAIKLSEQENGELETWDKTLSKEEFTKRYFNPYMKIMKICTKQDTCGYKGARSWSHLNGNNGSIYNNPFENGRTPMLGMDGIIYVFGFSPDRPLADNENIIIIDINGSEKPNKFGQDVFFLIRNEEADSVTPYGANKGAVIKTDCSPKGTGMCCAAWIYQNGWNIPPGNPMK